MNINHIEYELLTGQTKEEIFEQLGFCFNDYISDVWMYRLDTKKCILVKNIYTYFLNLILLQNLN